MVDNAKLNKLYDDMYIGGGKGSPSITIRVAIIEEQQEQAVATLERIEKNQNKLFWAVLGLMASVLGEIFVKGFIK